MDFLQFRRDFVPQAKWEQAFIYIIHKPIDFSYRLKTIGFRQVRVSSGNLVPSPTENHLLSLRASRSKMSTFGKFANKPFWPYFANVH